MRSMIRALAVGLFAMVVFSSAAMAETNIRVIPGHGSISGRQIKLIVRVIRLTDSYMLKNFGLTLSRTVEVGAGAEGAGHIDSRIGGLSAGALVRIFIRPGTGDGAVVLTAAHELVHQYQADYAGSMEPLVKNMWLTEGMADVLAARISAGLMQDLPRRFRLGVLPYDGELRLSEITTKDGWDKAFAAGLNPYAKAGAAVLFLTEHHPPRLLLDYLDALRESSADDALAQVYGIDMDTLDKLTGSRRYKSRHLQ